MNVPYIYDKIARYIEVSHFSLQQKTSFDEILIFDNMSQLDDGRYFIFLSDILGGMIRCMCDVTCLPLSAPRALCCVVRISSAFFDRAPGVADVGGKKQEN